MSSVPELHRPYPHPVLLVLYAAALLFGGAVVVFAFVSASREVLPHAPIPQVAKEQDVISIRKVLEDQDAAWNRGDLRGFMAGYWQSSELSFYSGKDKRQGWQETFDRYRNRYQGQGKEMGRVSFTELEIQMLGPDTALVRGRWKVIMSKEQPEGLFTLVMKRFPEGWRIIHDHTSSD
jgi:beta-aspartyl-peptidase (threonine type)